MECSLCKKPTNKCCSRCKVKYYCSQSCQKKDYPNHVLDCPRRSADILVKNVFQSLMPTNIAVLYEYGFENCNNAEDRTKLLGLYIGLIKIIGCSASQVHSWWESGELSINIKKTYDDGGYTSGYYDWVLRNEHLLQGLHKYEGENSDKSIVDKFLSFAKPYLSKHDQTISFKSLPESKRNVSFLYTSVIQGFVPRIEERNWIDFGFCTCESISKEYQLRDLYQELIVQRGCKIDEFNDAYMSGTVLDLLKKKINICGWLSESKIEIFGYEQPIKSVYHLKQYVLSKSVDLIPAVKVDYGFINCRTEEEKKQLEHMYENLINNHKFDSLDLHKACITGKIFNYVRSILPNEKLKADLLKNPDRKSVV